MEDAIIKRIKTRHPDFYAATKDLVLFDYKVEQKIKSKYGENTYENIQKTVEYGQAIHDDAQNSFTKYAERRKPLYKRYNDEAYKVYEKIGFKSAMLASDIIKKHLKSVAPILL